MIKNKSKIEGDKVYMNFTEFIGENWGYNHKTF